MSTDGLVGTSKEGFSRKHRFQPNTLRHPAGSGCQAPPCQRSEQHNGFRKPPCGGAIRRISPTQHCLRLSSSYAGQIEWSATALRSAAPANAAPYADLPAVQLVAWSVESLRLMMSCRESKNWNLLIS